jgi:phosphopentomutase
MGKIGDIFAHRGVSEMCKAHGNMPLFDLTPEAMDDARDGDLVFANFVDFDSEFGHRRDVAGYAAALEAFDKRPLEVLAKLRQGDLLVVTADHGNDPTWVGTDHTCEQVPILCCGSGLGPGCVGRRPFQDIGASIAAHLRLPAGSVDGASFLNRAPAGPQDGSALIQAGV